MTIPDPWTEAAALRAQALQLDEAAERLRTHAQRIEHMALVGVRRVRSSEVAGRTGTIVELELPEEGVALVEWDDDTFKDPRPVTHRRLRPAKPRHPESEIPVFQDPGGECP
jgi:hypothetical protein